MVMKSIGGLVRSEEGNAAIWFGLMLNILLVSLALPLDIGRAYLARTDMAGAADAAAVAAAVALDGEPDVTAPSAVALRDKVAKMYFTANMPEKSTRFGISYKYNTNVVVDYTDGNEALRVVPTDFTVPVYFGFLSDKKRVLEVSAINEVNLANSYIQPVDYYFVFDTSDSMKWAIKGDSTTKIQALRDAAQNMIKAIYPDGVVGKNAKGQPFYRVSISQYKEYSRNPETGLTTDIAKLNGLIASLKPEGNTCGGCGVQNLNDFLRDRRSDALQIVIFMTDGLANYAYKEMKGSAPQALAKPDYGNYFPFDPKSKTAFPADFNYPYSAGLSDPKSDLIVNGDGAGGDGSAKPGHDGQVNRNADLAMYCNDVKKAYTPTPIFWTISFGEAKDAVEGMSQSFVLQRVGNYTMDYCATDDSHHLYATNGLELNKIFQQIVKETSRVRIIK